MRLKLVTIAGFVAASLPAAAAGQGQGSAQKAAPAIKPQTPSPTTTAPTTTTQPTATTTTPDEAATPQSTAPGQTQTTPGQSQTSPGGASQLTPAVTGQTPSGQSVPNQAADQAQAGKITKATAADIKAGVSVYDQKSGLVGKIVSSSAKGAVLDTGTTKVTIPASSFAKSDKGLVIGTTKSAIDAAAKPTTAKAEKTAKKPK
jgi:hypothetical protein